MRARLVLVAVVATLASATACGDDSPADEDLSPRDTVIAWIEALDDGRWGDACDLSTEGNVRALGGRDGCIDHFRGHWKGDSQGAYLDGENDGEFAVRTADGGRVSVRVEREDGRNRVHFELSSVR